MKWIYAKITSLFLLAMLLSGCGLSFYDDMVASAQKAMVGGGAVAGKDYVNGLMPSQDSRRYFAKSTDAGSSIETVYRTQNTSETGVKYVKDGGILIPPGTTISYSNKGYCMDPSLPAPKSGEEIQFVKTSLLIPDELQETYKKLMNRAASGDMNVHNNLQHLVWALRTAGTDMGFASNLTPQQKKILNSCSGEEGLFEAFHENAKSMDQFWRTLFGLADSYLNISVGGVTYKVSDLLDPNVGNKKINAHLEQLFQISDSLPVEKKGFNYGELKKGVYTDIRGDGYLSFHAKIANSTDQSYIFYPTDYVGQVGSGTKSQGLTFFAMGNTTMRQRITQTVPQQIQVIEQKKPETTLTPHYSSQQTLSSFLNLPETREQALENILQKGADTVYSEMVTASIIQSGGKYSNLLKDATTKIKGKNIIFKHGTFLNYDFGYFVGDFCTSIALGDWQGAAAATERYVVDTVFGPIKFMYDLATLAGGLF